MIIDIIIFLVALSTLLVAANYFTNSAEAIGAWFKLPPFVIGVFIVGIGTSLPELISGIISINNGASEILPGNVIGSNISNILLITGLAVIINRKKIILESNYLYIDLHFLLGSFIFFYMIAFDGNINPIEASIGIILFIIYSIYLIKEGTKEAANIDVPIKKPPIPIKYILILIATGVGIYLGAEYTVSSLNSIAITLGIPSSIIALTLLSLGTTLPELAVNISAIKKGKAELAIGNVLGSCIFNSLAISGICSLFGNIVVPQNLLSFSLPMMAVSGLLFYLLTQDKNISVWEGMLIVGIYVLFILQIATMV
jgi:cation:H+ antiporter